LGDFPFRLLFSSLRQDACPKIELLFLFSPFSAFCGSASGGNFLFSETEKKLQCHPVKIENFPGLSPRNFEEIPEGKNQKLTTKGSPERSRGTKICQRKHALSEVEGSTSGLSDGLMLRLYNTLHSFFSAAG